MKRRLLKAVMVACVAGALSAAPASAALETIVQDDAVMLYSTPENVRAAAQRLKLLGVDQVRITANWSVIAPDATSTKKPNFDARDSAAYEQARWANLDHAVRETHEAGMRAFIDVGFWAPRWATSSRHKYRARKNIKPRDYADFAVALVRRYSGTFVIPSAASSRPPAPPVPDDYLFPQILMPLFPSVPPRPPPPPPADEPLPRVDVFALWNEPNQNGFMAPQWKSDKKTPASPRIYRRMVRYAYPAIKSVRADSTVLIGNTSSSAGRRGEGPVAPLEFLREFACVNRALKRRTGRDCANFTRMPGDGWAHHPYTRNEIPSVSGRRRGPDDVRIADLPVLARTLAALVRRGRLSRGYRRIYLTEFGFETKRVPGRPTVSQSNQARWLTWSEYLADRVPAVRSFAQFLLRDQPRAPVVVSKSRNRPYGEYSTGLLRANGKSKTAARTFRAGLFAGFRRGSRRVVLYGRLRLGSGEKDITLERRRRTRWTAIARLKVDGQGSFSRTFSHRRNAVYRLTYPGGDGERRHGLVVRPVYPRR